MRTFIFILLIIPQVTLGQGKFETIDTTLSSFLSTLEESNDLNRFQQLNELLKPGAQINAITASEDQPPTYATGDLMSFYENTKTFYSGYEFSYDEVERDINYYSNLASVNSLVYQRLTRRSDGKSYQQMLWFSIDLVFDGNRWWVLSASWINETERSSIRNVMSEDTLWHDLSQ